ncbi:MAG: porin family protein [Alphaproteobacteria bacterium]|nr:porin family protein [Alphaproteobacteria bacterium]
MKRTLLALTALSSLVLFSNSALAASSYNQKVSNQQISQSRKEQTYLNNKHRSTPDFQYFIGLKIGGANVNYKKDAPKYLKSEGEYKTLDDMDYSKGFATFSGELGFRYNLFERFAIGARAYAEQSSTNDTTIKNHTTGDKDKYEFSFFSVGGDINLIFPLTNKLDFFTSTGVGYYEFKTRSKHNGHSWKEQEEKHTGVRVGGGLEYKINENVSLYADGHFVKMVTYDKDKRNKNAFKSISEGAGGVKFYF